MRIRVIAAAALLTAALTVSWLSLRYVRETGGKIAALLEEARAAYDAGGDYAAALDGALEIWEEKRGTLGALLKHNDTDEIEKLFYRIRQHRQDGRTEPLFEAVEDCRAAVAVMLRGEAPALRNIF